MFEEAKRVACIWFLEGRGQNILACVFQEQDDRWVAEYRFRYYRDNKAHDSADERNWYRIAPDPTAAVPSGAIEAKLVQTLDDILGMLMIKGYGPGPIHRLEVNGDPEKAFDIMAKQPWCAIKFVTPDGRAPAQA